ncbi:tRNA lysidine(34) synthetase TilS [Acinetobacter larvae]|uniref:tRNA(Ile)-lysidine synthase n=1 Tax=Acinetobacter larvae TaxID=1789224 RepID=A0A1B2M4A6_9GAMM|nr:tRNA lysidine(34) synthetase TilS [Acinetobacter larvae]
MDSMLLLFVLAQLFPQRVRAIYIDHQLQAASSSWGQQVQQCCQDWQIDCQIQAVDVAAGNLENQAREARYRAFQQHLLQHEILVLAHHQQDQAETILLNLLSGSGVDGLAAMPSIQYREHFCIWRPLLSLSRQQIEQWGGQLHLQYVNDPTNLDTQYDRAWCRRELWPVLTQRFPHMQNALSRSSYLMQDAQQILFEVCQQDLTHCGNAELLNLDRLAQLSAARQRQLLSTWMRGDAVYRPALAMVQRLQTEVIAARPDAEAALHCQGFYYVRFQAHLYRLSARKYLAQRAKKPLTAQTILCQLGQELLLESGSFKIAHAQQGLSASLLGETLTLQYRQGGEKIHLYGRVGRWPLKKALQQANIFPWMRHTIQILWRDNVMLGVFTPNGFWLAQSDYCVENGWLPSLMSK